MTGAGNAETRKPHNNTFTDTDIARKAGSLGGKALIAKYGRDVLKSRGSSGGSNTLKKHGTEHFSRIGREGAKKRWGK